MIRAGTFRFAFGLVLMAGSAAVGIVNYLAGPETRARADSPYAQCQSMRVGSEKGDFIIAELALTAGEQEKGLQGRDSLDPDGGMIFIFPEPLTPSFWMKGVRFPLDLIFVAPGGKVIELRRSAEPGSEQLLTPGGPVIAVVETAPGRFGNLAPGMQIALDCLGDQAAER